MRFWFFVTLVALGCSDAREPSCASDNACPQTYMCRAGLCLRFVLDAGTPRDPGDAASADE